MRILAVDPGPEQSAWLSFDLATRMPIDWAKEPNTLTLAAIERAGYDALAVEMIASYGMPVGAEVFETCVWIGRFMQASPLSEDRIVRPTRGQCKTHLCHSQRATDANIRQALIDLYGPGKSAAIGLKASRGPLYGITGDCWAALAVAVTVAATFDARAELVA